MKKSLKCMTVLALIAYFSTSLFHVSASRNDNRRNRLNDRTRAVNENAARIPYGVQIGANPQNRIYPGDPGYPRTLEDVRINMEVTAEAVFVICPGLKPMFDQKVAQFQEAVNDLNLTEDQKRYIRMKCSEVPCRIFEIPVENVQQNFELTRDYREKRAAIGNLIVDLIRDGGFESYNIMQQYLYLTLIQSI